MKGVAQESLLTERREAAIAEPQVAVSVVVPVAERPESLALLYREFSAPLRRAHIPFEFIS